MHAEPVAASPLAPVPARALTPPLATAPQAPTTVTTPSASAAPISVGTGPIAAQFVSAEPSQGGRAQGWRLTPSTHPAVAGAPRQPSDTSPRDARRAFGESDPIAVERLIGGRWAAAIGAIIVIIAIGLFLQLAYESEWFGLIPPALRCGFAAIFGVLLLIAGEVVCRRVSTVAAIGLWIAGLGAIYLTVYAASAGLGLIGPTAALLLMIIVCLGGVGLTIRAGSVTVGVLSVAAGYAAPLLLSSDQEQPLALPILMTMLLAVGLTLSAAASLGVAPLRFRLIRSLVLVMHVAVSSVWWLMAEPDIAVMVVFLVLWWCIAHGEALLASLLARGHQGAPVISMMVTAWVSCHGVLAIREAGMADGIWASGLLLGLAVLAVGAISTVGPGLGALRRRPQDPLDAFAISSWIQAGILIVAAAAAQFGGAGLTLIWLAIAAASIELARRVESIGVTVFGWIVLVLGVSKLLTVDLLLNNALQQPLFSDLMAFGVAPTGWSLLAFAGAAATILAGVRLGHPRGPASQVLQSAAIVVGIAIAMGALHAAMRENQPLASMIWGSVGAGLIALGFRRQTQPLRIAGLIVLGLTVLKFLFIDLHGSETLWRVTSMLVVGLLLVGVSVVYLRMERASRRPEEADGDGSPTTGTHRMGEVTEMEPPAAPGG